MPPPPRLRRRAIRRASLWRSRTHVDLSRRTWGGRVCAGAGLSKVNASPCWRALTCTTTHYETQPNPTPLAWLMHRLPLPVHKAEVLVNHFVELAVPWLLLVPHRWPQAAGAAIQARACPPPPTAPAGSLYSSGSKHDAGARGSCAPQERPHLAARWTPDFK